MIMTKVIIGFYYLIYPEDKFLLNHLNPIRKTFHRYEHLLKYALTFQNTIFQKGNKIY